MRRVTYKDGIAAEAVIRRPPAGANTAHIMDSIDSPQPTFGVGDKPELPLRDTWVSRALFGAGRSAEVDFVSEPDADDDETVPGKFNEDPAESDDGDDEDDEDADWDGDDSDDEDDE